METNISSEDKSADKLHFLAKVMLEGQVEVQLTNVVKSIKLLITESWLDWWVLWKYYIFRAFKFKSELESNLAEIIHSLWLIKKHIQLCLYESANDKIDEMITAKQIMKG